MKLQWTLLIGLIFAIIIAIFAMVNMEKVPVDYVFGEAYWPLVLIILGSALIGALVSACFSMVRIFSQQRQVNQLQKKLNERDTIIVSKDTELVQLKRELDEQKTIVIENDFMEDKPLL